MPAVAVAAFITQARSQRLFVFQRRKRPARPAFFRSLRLGSGGWPLIAAARPEMDCSNGRLRRLLDERHAVVAGLDHRAVVVGQLPEDLLADGFFGLFQGDLAGLQAHAIDHDLHLVGHAFHVAERDHQPHHVPQAGQIELRDQQDLVAISRATRSMAV